MNHLEGLIKRFFGRKNNDELEIKSSETFESLFDKYINILDNFKTLTYIPLTEEHEASFSISSKFGGLPFLRDENDWIKCPDCHKRMTLFLQLNLSTLPENRFSEKQIAQYFYCDEHCQWETVLQNIDKPLFIPTDVDSNYMAEKVIVSWTEMDDYPHHEEYFELGITKAINQLRIPNEIEERIERKMEEQKIGLSLRQDKLFGWPSWEQESRYPINSNTNSSMSHLFQIISEDNLDYMFGDDGVVNLFYDNQKGLKIDSEWACG